MDEIRKKKKSKNDRKKKLLFPISSDEEFLKKVKSLKSFFFFKIICAHFNHIIRYTHSDYICSTIHFHPATIVNASNAMLVI